MTGVLLMAHGTPSSVEEMPEYLMLVRGGRPPSPALVDEMRHNYGAIGGRSPLTAITFAQAAALRARLGEAVPVAVGMRNWHPFIRDAVEELVRTRASRIVALPLAPQYSTLSVSKYVEAAVQATPPEVEIVAVSSYHIHPLLVDAFAARVTAARPAPDEEVVFTAHSLPTHAVEGGDPYPGEVAATARAVAARAGLANYQLAYQSAGRTPEPWIGPDLSDLLRLRAEGGVRRFLIVPIGFVCDHTEILFDIDVQAARVASGLGVKLRRTASLNDSPAFIALLEALVRDRL